MGPGVVGPALVHVRLVQHEVPTGVEGVDFKFVVGMGFAAGVHEDLEIGVLENDGVVFGEGGPDVRLFQFGGDVEEIVVPEQFGAGAEAGCWPGAVLDVNEIGGPFGLGPGGFVEVAVNGNRGGGVAAEVAAGNDRFHFLAPVIGRAGEAACGGCAGQQEQGEEATKCATRAAVPRKDMDRGWTRMDADGEQKNSLIRLDWA